MSIPPAVAEFAVEERQRLLDRIDEQAREIDANCMRETREIGILKRECDRLRNELAALKAQPSGVVLPPMVEFDDMVNRLFELDEDARKYCCRHWLLTLWKATLDRVCQLNSSPVSACEPVKCSYQDDPRSPSELSLAGCNCVRFGEGNPHWPCKLHPAASAGGLDERAAFNAYLNEVVETKQYGKLTIKLQRHDEYTARDEQIAMEAWKARAALTASAPNHSEQVREDYVQVPLVATLDMKNAGWQEIARQGIDPELCEMQPIYYAMLAAAPSAGSQGGAE